MKQDAINIIQKEFPNQSKPEDFVKAHEDTDHTQAFGDFFQLMLETGDPRALENQDAKFNVTFGLSFWERIKVLLTGKYDAMIGPLLSEAVGFGICWQHQDIIDTLEDYRNKSDREGDKH